MSGRSAGVEAQPAGIGPPVDGCRRDGVIIGRSKEDVPFHYGEGWCITGGAVDLTGPLRNRGKTGLPESGGGGSPTSLEGKMQAICDTWGVPSEEMEGVVPESLQE